MPVAPKFVYCRALSIVGNQLRTAAVFDFETKNSYSIRIRATDEGGLTFEKMFTVAVTNVNEAPILTFITNRVITPDGGAFFRIKAMDPDGDPLTYALIASTAAGATVNATNGSFLWRPTRALADTTNQFSIRVTDGGTPPLSVSQSFSVVVLDFLELGIGSTNLMGGETVSTPIYLDSNDGITNVQFSVQVPALDLTNWALLATAPQIASATLQDQFTNLVITLQTGPGLTLQNSQRVTQLVFTALTNRPSAFVPLIVNDISGNKPNGNSYNNRFANTPMVAVVQDLPFLQATVTTNQGRVLDLFGRVGTNYQLQFTTNVTSVSGWHQLVDYLQTNSVIRQGVSQQPPIIFYRVQQQ